MLESLLHKVGNIKGLVFAAGKLFGYFLCPAERLRLGRKLHDFGRGFNKKERKREREREREREIERERDRERER